MPTIINPLITDAGLTAAINASAASLQLAITHIALGSGQYTPSVGQTALTNRKEKVTVAGGFVSGVGGFRVNVAFPAWAGIPNPYNATEIGFYAGDPDAGGILFAVYSNPSSVIVQRNALDYVAQFGLQLSRVPAGSVSVTIDPGASQALALLSTHEAASNPHSVYALKTAIQNQASTAFTSSGVAPNFTLTPSPALTAYAANQRFRVNFNVAGSGVNAINVSALGNKLLKQYDSTGAKVAAVIAAGQLTDIEYDGVDFVILDPLPSMITDVVSAIKYRNAAVSGCAGLVEI